MEAETKPPVSATKAEQWERILAEWAGSGLSQAAFCERNNLKFHTFAYWRKKLKEHREASNRHSSGLVPVRLLPEPVPAEGLVLYIGDRVRLEVKPSFDPETLRRVVAALEGA